MVATLCDAGLDPVLVGGLAAALRAVPPAEDAWPAIDDPAHLATVVRPTGDIDLVVPGEFRVTAGILMRRGFAVIKQPARFARGGVVVDILLPAPQADSSVLAVELLPGDASEIDSLRVAGPATLVLEKAVAWSERFEGRDLADIAALALRDAVSRGAAGDVLREASLTSRHRAALSTVHATFFTEFERGPIAFADVVRALAFGRDVDRWDELEENIRRHACIAVRRLLAPFPASGR